LDVESPLLRQQIKELVRSFIRLWILVGAALPAELSRVHDFVCGLSGESEGGNAANYEGFFRVSSSLGISGSLTMGELAAGLTQPLSTTTRIVDWLVGEGYVERLPDPQDRRVVRVALTGDGRKMHLAMEKYIEEKVGQIIAPLSVTEKNALFKLVRKVVSASG